MKKFALAAALSISLFGLMSLATSAASSNMIANPSVETANSTGSLPISWNHDKWGSNTASFTYKTANANTGTRSLYVNMTSHSSGDAKWYFSDVAVKPSQKYSYSEFYKSNVATEVDIQYTDTSGRLSYIDLSNPAASGTSWKALNTSFTTPANVKTLTIFHLIKRVGWVQTDDFSLVEGTSTVTPTPPTVNLTSPAANATVSGTQAISANASDAVSVAGVQFKLDNTNIDTEDTTAPYSVNWDSKTVANGNHTISAVARNASGQTTTATETVNVQNVANPTPPSVTLTAPTNGSTVSGSAQVVSADASDSTGVKSVQFKLDNNNLGAADTTSPYSVSWDTKTATNAGHTLSAVVTNTAGVTANSSVINVTVNNPTPPTVNVTAPVANATLTGTQAITANASDAQGITSIQFKLNNVNLGPAITAAPYTYNWDTTTSTNGNYSLTAVATNKANLTTTSAAVAVSVSNQTSTGNNGPNLIPNPSLETANGTLPASWLSSNWGTNTSTFSYLNSGHTGGHSIEAQTTQYTNGAANWYYADVPVTAGTTYQYTNWYKSNVDTEVDAEVTMTDGTVNYYYLGTVLANTNWTKFTTTFVPPAGAKTMAAYQILAKVGYIISDDYSLSTYTPQQFNRGVVSVSFDDGWTNQYTNALPLLQKYNIPATFYIISGELTDQPDYMSANQVKSLFSNGDEIASHSVTHPDLTTVSQSQLVQEMQQSQATLQNTVGVPVTDFAYPFGAYNTNTLSVGSQYYQSQRSVNTGYNTKDNFNLTQLKIYEVDSNISQAQVKAWIDGAIAQKTWLILVYHEIAVTPSDPTDSLYDTQPTDLDAELSYLKNSGVAVETVHQAINEVLPQL